MDRATALAEIDDILARLRRVLVQLVDVKQPAMAAKPVSSTAAPMGSPIVDHRPLPVVTRVPAKVPHVRRTVGPDGRPPVTANGVVVNFADMTVEFNGKRQRMTNLRQCELVATLAKAKPHLIPTAELTERAWPDLSTDSRTTYLSTERHRLNEALNEIGLRLHHQYKFGFSLQENA